MTKFRDLFEHKGNELLIREQASYFIREAQNDTMEIGSLISQIAQSGHSDLAQYCERLLYLNAHVGNTLEQVQKSLK